MYSPSAGQPASHLIDHFESDIAWHRYWDARASDSSFPTNDGNAYHSVPLRGWTIESSNLVFPNYNWTRNSSTTATGQIWCKNLVLNVRRLPAPFTFDLAFRFTYIQPAQGGGTRPIIECGYYGGVRGLSSNGWQVSVPTGGDQVFNSGTVIVGQAVRYSLKVEADRSAVFTFTTDGTTPSYSSFAGSSYWHPGTTKVLGTSWPLYSTDNPGPPPYVPIRICVSQGATPASSGAKLDYLEVRVLDHTV